MILKNTLISAAIAATVSFTSVASANSGDLYVGADLGMMDSETGFKLFGGYGINENLSVEGAYASYAEESYGGVSASLTGFEIAGIYRMPLQDKITGFGKVGMSFWEADLDGGAYYYDASADGNDLFLGGGIEYPMQSNLDLRAGIDLYMGDIDETRLYGGLVYSIK